MKQIISIVLLLLSVSVHAEENPAALTAVENVLQKLNDDEQAKTANNEQSGVLPLDIEAVEQFIIVKPTATRWSGKYEQTYFGAAVVSPPKTNLKKDIRPMLRNRAILLATNEMASYKALEKYTSENGTFFADTDLLRQALLIASDGYQFNGTYRKTAKFVFDEGEFFVAVVAAKEENIDVSVEVKQENVLLKNYLTLLQKKIVTDEKSENDLIKGYIELLHQKLQRESENQPTENGGTVPPLTNPLTIGENQ